MYLNTDSVVDQTISALISNNFPPTELLNKCFTHLITILNNLIEKPNEEKYKIIKQTNDKILSEVLIFPEAIQLLYLIGFEEMEIDEIPCFLYNGGYDNTKTIENSLKILRNKHKNEVFSLLPKEIPLDPQSIAVNNEVQKRKNELEEMKEIKEHIIKDFEANKKFNLEAKKNFQSKRNSSDFQSFNQNSRKFIDSEGLSEIPQNNYKKTENMLKQRNSYNGNVKPIKKKTSLGGNKEKAKKTKIVSLKDYGKTD